MKAILEFNLPDDQMEFDRVNRAMDMACALFDILNLRKRLSGHYDAFTDENIPDAYDALYRMADEIAEILNDHNIVIDKLID